MSAYAGMIVAAPGGSAQLINLVVLSQAVHIPLLDSAARIREDESLDARPPRLQLQPMAQKPGSLL